MKIEEYFHSLKCIYAILSEQLNPSTVWTSHCLFGRIKNDDKMIQAEGVESLSEAELRQACRDRGLLGLLSVEEMRQQVNSRLHILHIFFIDYRKNDTIYNVDQTDEKLCQNFSP